MIKPAWAIAGVALLGTAGAAVALVASPGGEEEVVQQAQTATPAVELPTPSPLATGCPSLSLLGAKLHRWGDLTIMVPEGIFALGDTAYHGGPVMTIFPEEINQSYRTQIDATTGSILSVSNDPTGVRPKEAEIQAALATISICPFDPTTATWPYNGDPSHLARNTLGNITYIEPDPATGMQVLQGGACSDSTGEGGCRDFLDVRTARSQMYIDSQTGQVMEPAKIAPEEQAAFERYLATVQANNP